MQAHTEMSHKQEGLKINSNSQSLGGGRESMKGKFGFLHFPKSKTHPFVRLLIM